MDAQFSKRFKTWNKKIKPDCPIDLIVDILSRLPVKCLMRLQCVCKLWYALIFHPYFIETHLKRSKKKPCYLVKANNKITHVRGTPRIHPLCFYAKNEVPYQVFQPNEMGGGQLSIADTCNGLVCFTDFYNYEPICIYNPATREYTILPKPFPYQTLDVALTYDPKTKEYKVFRLFPGDFADFRVSQYEIFTLGSDHQSWKHKGYIPYYTNESKHIQADGATHWLFGIKRHVHSILSINISTEDFKVHTLPTTLDNDSLVPYLIELNGHLGLCLMSRFRLEISVLDRKNSTWTKKYNLTVPQWITRSSQVRTWVCSTSMRNAEIIIARGRYKLVYFNVDTKRSRRIDTSIVGQWTDLLAMDHIESLVPSKFRWNSVRWPEIMDILDNTFPEYKQEGWRIDLELKL